MMTAREMTAQIRQLKPYVDQDLWRHKLGNGVEVHVCCAPQRHFGVFYLVWVTTRGGKSPRKQKFTSAKLTAMTPTTAGKKARSLVTLYGDRS
jgi:hypothetical protein